MTVHQNTFYTRTNGLRQKYAVCPVPLLYTTLFILSIRNIISLIQRSTCEMGYQYREKEFDQYGCVHWEIHQKQEVSSANYCTGCNTILCKGIYALCFWKICLNECYMCKQHNTFLLHLPLTCIFLPPCTYHVRSRFGPSSDFFCAKPQILALYSR